MKRSTFLAFAILFVMGTAQARSNLTREVTFESGNADNGWSGTNKDTDTMSSLSLSSPSRRGKRSMKADRRQGTNRSEVSDRIKGRPPLHKEVWYGWSLRVDKNTNSNGNRRLIVSQLHHHQAENRPNQWSQTGSFIIRHDASTNTFTLKHGYQSSPKKRKDNYVTLGKTKYKQWYDFVVHAKWTWRNDGFLKIWMDGKLVYQKKGSTYFDYGSKTKGPYFKAGAYTDKRPALVYVDEYRMGNANARYADVDPAGKDEPEPPPPPPPPPDPDPLPELRVTGITWGKAGDNYVGIELEPVDPDADPQLGKRTYKPGSVTFFTVDSSGVKQLTIHRQDQTDEGKPVGWTFYLDKPVPQEPIRVVAEKDWIEGAPSIDILIPRWEEPGTEPATTMDAVIGIEPQN